MPDLPSQRIGERVSAEGGRRRVSLLERLYVSGNIERPDRGQRQPAILAPGEELVAGPRVSPARMRVADVRGEESM